PASDALFAVNGNAYVKKLFVTLTGWPDYVFHKEYKLPGLPEVERYIALHQHLPGVTSADEIIKKGLDLGAGEAELLKKIEELTLYLIGQNKEMEALKSDRDRRSEDQQKQQERLREQDERLEKQQRDLEKQRRDIDELRAIVGRLSNGK
ncbi:MAG: hypothetical protein P4L51_20355, partial [Puia sp.]|nr:hypothetical protein [Puia sp.]